MKKRKLIFLTILLTVISCSDDDGCKCDLKVTEDGTSYYYVTNVPTDCDGNYDRPSSIPSNHFIVGCENEE